MITGPNTVNDGLVFGYDADDRSTRFYPGEPTTNLLTLNLSQTGVDGSGQDVIGTRTIIGLNHVRIVDINSNTRQNNTIYSGLVGGSVYTISIWFKKISGEPTFRFQIQGLTNGVTTSTYHISTIQLGILNIDDWQLGKWTFTLGSNENGLRIYYQDGVDYTTYTHSFELKNPQLENKNHPTQFTLPSTTRGATQSLIDLKKNKTIDISNVSFDWKGRPYFYSGTTGNLLDLGSFPELDTGDVSIDFWAKDLNSMVIVGKHYNNFEIRGNSSRFSGYIGTTTGWYDFGVNANISHGISANDVKSKYNHFCYVLSFLEKKMYFYANGQLKGTHPYSNMYHYTTGTNLYIGQRHDGTGKFSGNIPIIKIYNKSLTESEVLQNYNASKGRFELENRLSDGLVLHLDAGNKNSLVSGSTTWYDLAGSNNGTLTNGPSFSSVPESLSFDGVDDYAEFGDVLDLGTNNMTICCWVNIKQKSGNKYIMSKSKAAAQSWRFGIALNDVNSPYAFIQGNGGEDIGPSAVNTLNTNTWYHLTWTFNRSSNVDIYINSVQQSLSGNSTISQWNNGDFQSNNPFRIGCYTYGDNIAPTALFNGSISDFKVYHRLLTPQEIQQSYNSTKSRYGL